MTYEINGFGDLISRLFESLFSAYELLETSLTLPLAIVTVLPGLLSASVSIVVLVMVVKFIVGR